MIAHSQVSGITVPSHSIAINKDSLLYSILGKEYIQVNSFHHQAVKDVADSLIVAGVSADSLVEAICLKDYKFLLGVQWHPEHLFRTDEDSLKIFTAFVHACME
jgi:putative glutamine amidotransferase